MGAGGDLLQGVVTSRSVWWDRWRALGGPDQVSQGFFRSAPQLAAQQQSHHPAPPPGREVEVSIETDERAAFLRLGERDVLVVLDAEGNVHHQVEPAVLRVHAPNVDAHRPMTS
jgi:hypothetical protein